MERIESGGTKRVRDGLFVAPEPETVDLTPVALSGRTAGIISRPLGFRLDPGERLRAATNRALGSQNGEAVRAIATILEPETAFSAILAEHAWADAPGRRRRRPSPRNEAATELVAAICSTDVTERLVGAAHCVLCARFGIRPIPSLGCA